MRRLKGREKREDGTDLHRVDGIADEADLRRKAG